MTSTVSPKQMTAAGSAAVRDLIRGPVRPGKRIGAFPTAVYVRLSGGTVIAVLTHEAVRLPLGLVLSTSSTENPLDRLDGPTLIGSSRVRLGDLLVRLSRLVSVRPPMGLTPNAAATKRAWATLCSHEFAEHGTGVLDSLARSAQNPQVATDLARSLVGAGTGLTPSGDDLLAGFLVATWSFGVRTDSLRAAVLAAVPGGTTDLSGALLGHACRGESIPQVRALLLALSAGTPPGGHADKALADLIRIGHTSGAALATGVLAAATMARLAPDQR